jgi:hypothetical protein
MKPLIAILIILGVVFGFYQLMLRGIQLIHVADFYDTKARVLINTYDTDAFDQIATAEFGSFITDDNGAYLSGLKAQYSAVTTNGYPKVFTLKNIFAQEYEPIVITEKIEFDFAKATVIMRFVNSVTDRKIWLLDSYTINKLEL